MSALLRLVGGPRAGVTRRLHVVRELGLAVGGDDGSNYRINGNGSSCDDGGVSESGSGGDGSSTGYQVQCLVHGVFAGDGCAACRCDEMAFGEAGLFRPCGDNSRGASGGDGGNGGRLLLLPAEADDELSSATVALGFALATRAGTAGDVARAATAVARELRLGNVQTRQRSWR